MLWLVGISVAFANHKVSFALIHPRQKPLGHLQVMLLLQSREKKGKKASQNVRQEFFVWHGVLPLADHSKQRHFEP